MKAIILAAGMGTRLGRYTEGLPKGMLEFGGKSLIERQVEVLRKVGVDDIVIVKGYMPDKINIPGVKYYVSEDYANTNMVESLFCAESEMDDDVIVCYSDIIYEEKVIRKVLGSNADVGVCVDDDYWDYWSARMDNPKEDMESLVIDSDGEIVDLGDTSCLRNKAKYRYVGLIKFSKKGVEDLKRVYYENRKRFFDDDEPWLRSKSFKKAYMTCMLQALINDGCKVEPIVISRGWMEFDNVEDYEKAVDWLKSGEIKRFINLDRVWKIAISQRVVFSEKGADRDCLEQDYVEYYKKFGFVLIPVPNVVGGVERWLDGLGIDGIILSGGNDVSPNLYGGVSEGSDYSELRDGSERKMLDYAVRKKIPVLCECRGIQFLNVYFGGGLLQNVGKENHVDKNHDVEIVDERFRGIFGKGESIVNSYHNHCISESELSEKLKAFAKSADGFIEGVYHPDLPIVGIFWHPERESPDNVFNEKLIKWFIEIIDNGKS